MQEQKKQPPVIRARRVRRRRSSARSAEPRPRTTYTHAKARPRQGFLYLPVLFLMAAIALTACVLLFRHWSPQQIQYDNATEPAQLRETSPTTEVRSLQAAIDSPVQLLNRGESPMVETFVIPSTPVRLPEPTAAPTTQPSAAVASEGHDVTQDPTTQGERDGAIAERGDGTKAKPDRPATDTNTAASTTAGASSREKGLEASAGGSEKTAAKLDKTGSDPTTGLKQPASGEKAQGQDQAPDADKLQEKKTAEDRAIAKTTAPASEEPETDKEAKPEGEALTRSDAKTDRLADLSAKHANTEGATDAEKNSTETKAEQPKGVADDQGEPETVEDRAEDGVQASESLAEPEGSEGLNPMIDGAPAELLGPVDPSRITPDGHEGQTLYASDHELRVRQEPNLASKVITLVRRGQAFRVINLKNEDFACVEWDGKPAFVSRAFLQDEEPSEETTAKEADDLRREQEGEAATAVAEPRSPEIVKALVDTALSMRGAYTGDCSSFVQSVYRKNGISIPRSTRGYPGEGGQWVAEEALRPGDLVLYDSMNAGETTHVAIYVGDGEVCHVNTLVGVIKKESIHLHHGGYPITGYVRYSHKDNGQ